MRIGLFAHRLAQANSTGIGRYVRELVGALDRMIDAGDELVLAATPEPQAPTWVPPGVQTRTVGSWRRGVQAAWCLGIGPQVERSLGRLDVLHLLYPFPPARSAAPQVVMVHDVMPFERPEWYPRSQVVVYRRTMRVVLRRASRVVVPSEHVARRLTATLEVDPALVSVVPEGVSGAFSANGSTEDVHGICARAGVEPGRFAVAVGHVSARKNLIPVIRAMAEVGGGSLPLVIVGGDGHGAAAIDAEIQHARRRTLVRRLGYLPDDQVATLVKHAAVLVHPAMEEGFGLVPLEAMAVGTPVIAGRVSSIPEVVGDAALLVDRLGDPAAWADAISQVIGSADRRMALASAGPARAAQFTWDRAARAMLDIYRDVGRG